MAIDISAITDNSTGLIKKNKDLLDKLVTVITNYENILEDIGVNNEYELFSEIVDELEFSKNNFENLIYRLYKIQATGFKNNYIGLSEYGGLPQI